ncbi:pro-adrenomedullin-like [Clarias gariepinus]|uniref:pro-adrenomedullin-like n=1 Tax=Clarias gariepinus TaxID=13013 RepID=UPI00234C3EA4|nr:pro-adrenomedullin-like [Clarias gariepinus]
MKEVSLSILIWCFLAAFVHCDISAARPSGFDAEKKFDLALQKRYVSVPKRILGSINLLTEQESRNMERPGSQSSDDLNGKWKRGCNLLTCSVHDLAYRISQLSKKRNNAPIHKISPCGYGRRRRRSLLHRFIGPTYEECHLRHHSTEKLK